MRSRPDLSRARWRKSSHSGGSNSNCVEVATNLPDVVAIRDSKQLSGPVLTFTLAQWTTFLGRIKTSDY
jgi:hypothetical protein